MRPHTDRSLRILVARSSVGAEHVPLRLVNEDLEMVNLPFVDLRGANLAGANLRGAMLWGALLDLACLDDADLTCADLTWSSLTGASLRGTRLIEADLDETTVDFFGLESSITAGAERTTLTWSPGFAQLARERLARDGAPANPTPGETEARQAADEAILAAHRQAAPRSLRVRGAAGFTLGGDREFAGDWYAYKRNKLRQACARVLTDADLQDLLSWSSTTRKPLNLRGCNLSEANLRGAVLDGACLAFADLTGADTRGASLVGADRAESDGW